jgi:hypothetical protein
LLLFAKNNFHSGIVPSAAGASFTSIREKVNEEHAVTSSATIAFVILVALRFEKSFNARVSWVANVLNHFFFLI